MTVSVHSSPSAVDSDGAAPRRWRPYALGGIVLLSLVLCGWRTGGSSFWGNTYYSAAVESMSRNLTNFVFGSFDPAGVTTVDKPPLALWPQVFSTWIFGFHGWALMLPQIVETGAAVFLLHRTVRRWAGENAALLAAAVLATTPVVVAVGRVNNPDALLVLLCVAAAYSFTRSVEPNVPAASGTRWLLLTAFWVGCGFATKMVAAWMILPALVLGYLFGRTGTWPRRILDVAAAGVVLLASSSWWVVVTSLWPEPKPYVGGSTDGTAWDLIMGYNGLGRLFGGDGATSGDTRDPSWLWAMFDRDNGGQISWLLPLALLVLVVVTARGVRGAGAADPFARAHWLLWGVWLGSIGLVLGYSGETAQPYYTAQLAPAVAALTGPGLVLFWQRYRARGPGWLLLPFAIALTAGWAWVVIAREPEWYGWLRYAVLVLGAVAVAGLVLGRFAGAERGGHVAMALGVVTALCAPGTWSAIEAFVPEEGTIVAGSVSAGPATMFGGGIPGMLGGTELTTIMRTGELPDGRRVDGIEISEGQRRMLEYVRRNAGPARIALAVEDGSLTASKFLLNSDVAAIGMGGGYTGMESVPDPRELDRWQRDGQLAFVYGHGPEARRDTAGPSPLNAPGPKQRDEWVREHCTVVPAEVYGGDAASAARLPNFLGGSADTLYDCLR